MARRVVGVGLAVGLIALLGCSSGDKPRSPAAGSDAPNGDGGLNAGATGAGNGGAGASGASGSSGQTGAGNGGAAGAGGSGNGGSGNGGSGMGGSGNGGAGDGSSGSAGDDAGMNDAGCATPEEEWLDASALPECEIEGCVNARCVTGNVLTEEQRELLADCGDGLKCIPDLLLETVGNFLLESCVSLGGAEGRCLSTCVPQVAEQADRLPQDVCADGELCTPCFDPFTGEETGACTQSCDPGPEEEPYVFADCCGGEGLCVPSEIVSDAERVLLGPLSCAEGNLCAPADVAADPSFVAESCDSLLGAEGRCQLACLPSVATQADRLPQDECPDTHLCAPCYDPVTGADTGACHVGGDEGPTEPPVVFEACCDDGDGGHLGSCVPTDLVPDDQLDLIAQDTCDSGQLCAPIEIAARTYVPRTCDFPGGAEARCLPACLPDVVERADNLVQADCEQGELCVPCFDPFSGESTGACELEGDEPEDEPTIFAGCCDDGTGDADLGTCVPTELVPGDQQALLGEDTCGEGELCAPTPIATGSYEPNVCQSWLGAEGRCLPACLPDVAAQAYALQDPDDDECDQGELCVPCFDPTTGDDTGACRLEGDEPANDTPETFPACCPTPSPGGMLRGTCVPARAAGAQAESLPNMNCETLTDDADDYVCAPNEKVFIPNEDFPSCTTVFAGPDNCGANFLCAIARGIASGYIGDKAGVCVPSCVLSEQETDVPLYGTYTGAQLYGQSTCASGEDCAPCEYPEGHPQVGESTGVCD